MYSLHHVVQLVIVLSDTLSSMLFILFMTLLAHLPPVFLSPSNVSMLSYASALVPRFSFSVCAHLVSLDAEIPVHKCKNLSTVVLVCDLLPRELYTLFWF